MIKYTKGMQTKRFLSFINSLWNFSELYWNQYEGENVFSLIKHTNIIKNCTKSKTL